MKQFILCTLICACIHAASHAQELSSTSRRAVKAYQNGYGKYTQRQYTEAVADLNTAIRLDSGFIEAYMLKAECLLETGDSRQAKEAFLQCTAIDPDFFPPVYYSLAEIEFSAGEYEEASRHIEKFLEYDRPHPLLTSKAQHLLTHSRFAQQAVKNPVPFQPQNAGLALMYDQYWPSLSVDGQTLVFTALIPKNPNSAAVTGNRHEEFFVSHLSDGRWSTPENLGSPPNSPDNEGAQTISIDASRMYFTACNRRDGMGGCDIYYSEKRSGQWTRPRNLGEPVNTASKETQPSLSADGRTLYFTSSRADGKGGQDIWTSTLDAKGNWGKPVNLEAINTPYDESSPFIHNDDRTLYFASAGWPGMGQYDIFVTRKDSAGKWTIPVNMGYPVNTRYSEEGMTVNARGNMAYYSSDREGSMRSIFTFELYPAIRPAPVSYMKGKIYDSQYYKPLQARFELIDLSQADQVITAISDSADGEFLVCLPSGKDYALNVSCDGYLFFSENFTMADGSYMEPYLKDIPLSRIKPGEKVILRNIFFDFASAQLLDESRAELQQLLQFMQSNPSVRIRITGHTDSTGSEAYNKELSQLRAYAVAGWLMKSGIESKRVSYTGLGASEPVAGNDTEEGRAQNRRTEMMITE